MEQRNTGKGKKELERKKTEGEGLSNEEGRLGKRKNEEEVGDGTEGEAKFNRNRNDSVGGCQQEVELNGFEMQR